jgi:glycosyltransferase involved in cell wall biosynthesis
MKRLAIVTTHPIQYNAPLFKLLAQSGSVLPKVFYTWAQTAKGAKYDPGFGKHIEWDIPLLEGYDHCFVRNTAADPGTHHFRGIINPDLVSEIEAWAPDAVLIFGWSFQSHLKCIRHFHGKIPVLFRGDSTLLDERPGMRKLIRRIFLTWVCRHLDYALYVGAHNKNYFLKHRMPEDRLVFAPHAIDNDHFAEPDEVYSNEARLWRSRMGIEQDDFVVLFAGKLEPKKNPFFLLELALRIKSPNFKVLIIGSGVLEADLKKSAMGDNRVLFLDFQNQQAMPIVYRLADIFVLPSTGPGETWGLAVNEAMACGRPVLVSEKAGCSIDLVEERENGFVLKGNTSECVAFISALIANRDLRAEMGRRSREIIRHYSLEKVADAIVTTLYKISPKTDNLINHGYSRKVQ